MRVETRSKIRSTASDVYVTIAIEGADVFSTSHELPRLETEVSNLQWWVVENGILGARSLHVRESVVSHVGEIFQLKMSEIPCRVDDSQLFQYPRPDPHASNIMPPDSDLPNFMQLVGKQTCQSQVAIARSQQKTTNASL